MPKIYFKTNDDQIVIMNEILVRVFGRQIEYFDPEADYRKCTLKNPHKIDLTIDQLVSFKKFCKFHMLPAKFTAEDIRNLESIALETTSEFMRRQIRLIKFENNLIPLVECHINDTPLDKIQTFPKDKPARLHVKITINESSNAFQMNMYLDVARNYNDFFECFTSCTRTDDNDTPYHDLPFEASAQSGYYSIFYESQINIYTICHDRRNYMTCKNSIPLNYKKPLQQTIVLLHKTLHKFHILGHLSAEDKNKN
jgi:hypothetical protein